MSQHPLCTPHFGSYETDEGPTKVLHVKLIFTTVLRQHRRLEGFATLNASDLQLYAPVL